MKDRFSRVRRNIKLFKELDETAVPMEVFLEYREAVKIVRSTLGLPEKTKVFIRINEPLKEKFIDKINTLMRDPNKGKIHAIKYARAVAGCGLAEAKFFVDEIKINGPKFLDGEDMPGFENFDEEKVEISI